MVQVSGGNYCTAGEDIALERGRPGFYGNAKMVTDCSKHRNKIALDSALDALKNFLHNKLVSSDELWSYAKAAQGVDVIRPYMEAVA